MTSTLGDPSRQALTAIGGFFRNADLRRLGFAYLTSLVALWAYGIAISVYAFEIGGAPLVGIAAVIRLVPAAIVAPFAAVLADRYPRRRILICDRPHPGAAGRRRLRRGRLGGCRLLPSSPSPD